MDLIITTDASESFEQVETEPTPAMATLPTVTTTVAPPASNTHPPKPKMGGLSVGGAEIFAWTGGKPNATWTGLADPTTDESPGANCVRTGRPADVSKNWNLRVTPPATKFSKTDATYDFTMFCDDTLNHFDRSGMDTIMFVASLGDPTLMVSVIHDHEQVTLSHVTAESERLQPFFDNYDRKNDKDAKQYLESAVDLALRAELRLRQEPGDSAAITWMRILRLVYDGSVERFNRKKDLLKSLTPLTEPGENVHAYSGKVRRICMDLEQAHQFDWNLTLYIAKAFTQVSVEGFRIIWHAKKGAIDEALNECRFLTPDAIRRVMVSKGLHYTTLLTHAEEMYRSLLHNGEWPPAKVVTDPQQAPGAYLANMDQEAFNALVQSAVDQRMGAAKCYNCDKVGHAAKNCPDPKKEKPPGDQTNWRNKKPESGAALTKTVNGRTFHWCGKCNKGKGTWTGTHEGSAHKGRSPGAPDVPVAQPAPVVPPAPTPAPAANFALVGDGLGILSHF
jgi:Zinc knuckle